MLIIDLFIQETRFQIRNLIEDRRIKKDIMINVSFSLEELKELVSMDMFDFEF